MEKHVVWTWVPKPASPVSCICRVMVEPRKRTGTNWKNKSISTECETKDKNELLNSEKSAKLEY